MAYYRDGEFDSFNPDETVGFSHSFAGLSANLEKPNGWAYGENNQSSMDLHVSRMREYPSEDMRILPPISPYAGIHIRDVDDFFPRGFTCEELDRVYHRLLGYDEPKMYGLVAEAAEPFEDMDDYYNPGTETVSDAAIFEAIVVDHFSKTEHRMLAVKRAFKKYMGDSEIQVLDPIVGKPKTTGGFAYVTVQFPFTDGQVITIVFHSPEGDKKKIGPQDQIIAYQWLLNKRDITEVVAPENGKEISLENICKKTSQLLIKNSKRFEKQQKQAIEEKKQLTELTAQVKEAEAHQAELMDQVAAQQQTKSDLELELSQTLALVEKQKAINAELQATLDGLRKGAKKAEKAAGSTQTGNTATTDETGNKEMSVAEAREQLRETMKNGSFEDVFFAAYDHGDKFVQQPAGTFPSDSVYACSLGMLWRKDGNPRPDSITAKKNWEKYHSVLLNFNEAIIGGNELSIEAILKVRSGKWEWSAKREELIKQQLKTNNPDYKGEKVGEMPIACSEATGLPVGPVYLDDDTKRRWQEDGGKTVPALSFFTVSELAIGCVKDFEQLYESSNKALLWMYDKRHDTLIGMRQKGNSYYIVDFLQYNAHAVKSVNLLWTRGSTKDDLDDMVSGFDRNALIATAAKKKNIPAKKLEQMSEVELLCAAGKYADLSFDEQDNQATLFFENAKKLAKDNDAASLEKMAKRNNTTAMVALYYQYKDANNPDEAFKWYQKAAEAGNVAAQRDMPLLLAEQPDPDKFEDPEKASYVNQVKESYTKKLLEKSNYWLKKAAEQGSIAAMEEFNENDIKLNKEVFVGVIPSNIAEAAGMRAAPMIFLKSNVRDEIQNEKKKIVPALETMTVSEIAEYVLEHLDSVYFSPLHQKYFLVNKEHNWSIGLEKDGNSYSVAYVVPTLTDRMGTLLWTAKTADTNTTPATPVNPSGEKNSKLTPDPAYMAEIQDIIDGKQDAMGSKAMGKRLDAIYVLSEKDGTLDTVEPLLSKAADRVTMLSKKEHEHA